MDDRERLDGPVPGEGARGDGPRDDGRRDDGLRNGHSSDAALRRVERPDAPAYLRTYLERTARRGGDGAEAGTEGGGDARNGTAGTSANGTSANGTSANGTSANGTSADGMSSDDEGSTLPLYLRRFRARHGVESVVVPSADPIPGEEAPTWTEAWAATSRSPEIILPPGRRPSRDGDDEIVDVHLVRHGETQGYSANAGLSPMGRWQAHRRGHDLSKGIRDGQAVRIVCAPTSRATQTANQIRRGLDDGLVLWGRRAPVEGPVAMDEFRNFSVWTPSGEKDVTSAFREYHAVSERFERIALGDRPLWLVEIDRFYRLQMGGGDAIHFWMTVPLVNFEPPAAVVLRFWAGIAEAVRATPPGGSVLIATHSGPIRSFATWALGHDAGEPYNVEEVRVRVRRSLREAQVTYRNRTSEIQVPAAGEWGSWWSERAAALAAGVLADAAEDERASASA